MQNRRAFIRENAKKEMTKAKKYDIVYCGYVNYKIWGLPYIPALSEQ